MIPNPFLAGKSIDIGPFKNFVKKQRGILLARKIIGKNFLQEKNIFAQKISKFGRDGFDEEIQYL